MARKSRPDELVAQKARADAIRRARDARNRSLTVPEPAGAAEHGPDEGVSPARPGKAGRGNPNYVDLIDREMRRPKKVPSK
jgi:hypothetical protein